MTNHLGKIASGTALLMLATGVASAENDMDAPIQHFIHKFDGEAKYPADVKATPT